MDHPSKLNVEELLKGFAAPRGPEQHPFCVCLDNPTSADAIAAAVRSEPLRSMLATVLEMRRRKIPPLRAQSEIVDLLLQYVDASLDQ